jgi:tellurite methyltransferase
MSEQGSASWEQYHRDLESSGHALLWPDDFVIRFVNGVVLPRGQRRILEVGCGAGRHVVLFARSGLEVVGTDLAQSALDFTRRRLEQEGLAGVRLEQAHAGELPFPDASFDALLAWRFLHVLGRDEARTAVAEMARVLRPGGSILVGTRSPRSTNHALVQQGRGADRDFAYRDGQLSERAVADVYYTREELAELFGAFKEIAIEHIEWTRQNGAFTVAYWSLSGTR